MKKSTKYTKHIETISGTKTLNYVFKELLPDQSYVKEWSMDNIKNKIKLAKWHLCEEQQVIPNGITEEMRTT